MKKIIIPVIALIVSLILPLTAMADANSVEYKDEETGTVFIVPAGWRFIEGEEIQYECDYCFVHEESENDDSDEEEEENVTAYISYTSSDYYSSLSDEEKQGKGREDFDLSCLSKKDIADYLASYNKLDYYRFTAKAKNFTSSLGKKQRVTGYITLVDGYMYQIMFFDGTTSPIYDDFKTLMGSVEIPGTVPEKPKKEKILTPVKIVSLIIMLAAAGVFVTVIIKNKK